MADTKSKAQILATYTESCFGHVGPMMEAAELRRLDAVEAERDALRAENKKIREVLASRRAIFQAGRDSYETAAQPMNTDQEAWDAYWRSFDAKAMGKP